MKTTKTFIEYFCYFIFISNFFIHCSSFDSKRTEQAGKLGYVNAKSGLLIRENPGRTNPKITLVPFGKEVSILRFTDVDDTIENIKAKWVEVRYKEFQGFMFSGFLSSSPFTYGISDQFRASSAKSDDTFDNLDKNTCNEAKDKIYCFSDIGYKFLRTGYFKKAVTAFSAGLNIDPTNYYLLSNRGYSYHLLGDTENSLNDFEKAIQQKPNEFIAYYDRSLVYTKLKKFELALNDSKKSIQINSQSCASLVNLGWIHLLKSEWDKAKVELEKSIACDPGSAYPYANLAIYHYMAKKDKGKTFELLKKALELKYDIQFLYDPDGDGQFYKEWNQSPEFLKFIEKNR